MHFKIINGVKKFVQVSWRVVSVYVFGFGFYLVIFIRNLRESNFDFFVHSLKDMLLWLKVLNNIHYIRRLPILLHNMKKMPVDVTV